MELPGVALYTGPMRRIAPFAILLAVVILAGGVTLWSYSQSTKAPRAVLSLPCSATSAVKPTHFVTACADANTEVTNLHWYAWGDTTAYATGTLRYNDCTPSCVAGSWKSERVTVWAWRRINGAYTRIASSDSLRFGPQTTSAYPATAP